MKGLARQFAVLAVALCAAVLLPSAAGAVTFGSDLAPNPDNTITCADGWPNQLAAIYGFGQLFYNSGNGSCMWTSGSSIHSNYAPASGTITAVHVKVGPVTGPMQVVIIRSLYENTLTPGKPLFACCVIQQYGPTFTPAANSITTVPANLPVREDPTPPPEDTQTIAAGDAIALAVLAPNVPVPAAAGPPNLNADPTQPTDLGWFPAPSAAGIQAPSANAIQANGDWSGYTVLMSADLNGAGGGGVATPALALPQLTVPVRGGRASVPIRCTGAQCVGQLLLQNLGGTAANGKRGAAVAAKKTKKITYGSATFNVPAGSTKSVVVKLNAAGKKLLKSHRSAKVFANAKFTSGGSKSTRLTLTR